MEGNQIERFIKPWLDERINVAYRRRLVFQTPIDSVLAGVYFEPRPHTSQGIHLNAVVQPLYVPETDINFLGAIGVSPRTMWNFPDGPERETQLRAMLHEAFEVVLPAAIAAATPAALARRFWPPERQSNLNVAELLAYSLVWAGDVRRARMALEAILGQSATATIPWQQQLIDRARLVDADLNRGESGMDRLRAWRAQTLTYLGLDADAAADPR